MDDPIALLEMLGPSGTAVAVCLYLHKSFIAHSKFMLEMLLKEQEEDRKVFEQAVTKLDQRLQYLELLIKDMRDKR